MSKFHNGPQGPAPCTASKRPCPVGGEHFQSQEQAQAAYEKTMGEKHEPLAPLKKASGKPSVPLREQAQPLGASRPSQAFVRRHSVNAYTDRWEGFTTSEGTLHRMTPEDGSGAKFFMSKLNGPAWDQRTRAVTKEITPEQAAAYGVFESDEK